jgi:hypothetical protein
MAGASSRSFPAAFDTVYCKQQNMDCPFAKSFLCCTFSRRRIKVKSSLSNSVNKGTDILLWHFEKGTWRRLMGACGPFDQCEW